jgi:alkaline phosphatase
MKFKALLMTLPALILLALSCSQNTEKQKVPKNVIVLIGDGMGYNHVDATSIYLYGETGKLVFEGREWLKVAQATYPAVMRTEPQNIYAAGYNPRAAWSDTAYLKRDYTDSGAAGTALSTGYKTYQSAIGTGVEGDTLKHMAELAKKLGKSAGVVSSVQLSHATPAGFIAHNENRRNYIEIARQMIIESKLDVLIGCGHPMFDNDGKPAAEADYRYVGGAELWDQLNQVEMPASFTLDGKEFFVADIDGNGKPDAWTLVTDSVDFAALAYGRELPQRLLGIPQVHSTLQSSRSGTEVVEPWKQAMNPKLPSLEQKTLAAVNVLSQNPNGFFLMAEGGAIDWAAHDNHPGRMIEEMYDFERSVAAVVEWVETNSSWDETLVIVTSDHETGFLSGNDSDKQVMTPVLNHGKGVLPGMQWYSTDHTNSLVPVYARGKGSEWFNFFADEFDPVRGPFIQNTEVAKVVFLLWER